jgi:diguanylate cyclase (GGDEF)-like protein
MALNLNEVFDKYPNPLYIIRPIIENGATEDFEYMYVNDAFEQFLEKSKTELTGHRFREFYGPGESQWLDVFTEAAVGDKHFFVNNISEIINKKMYTEIFHVEPGMCGCIVHDYNEVSESIEEHQNAALLRQANCDYLTGFYNRFYLKEIQASIIQKENVGITYLDINNLKVTNDSLGHEAGDRLIIKAASMMKIFYKNSLIFRVGGDEFLIITDGCSREAFLEMSAESKKNFERDNFVALGYQFYDKIDNLQECISQCDQFMYEHKKHMKRNIIV